MSLFNLRLPSGTSRNAVEPAGLNIQAQVLHLGYGCSMPHTLQQPLACSLPLTLMPCSYFTPVLDPTTFLLLLYCVFWIPWLLTSGLVSTTNLDIPTDCLLKHGLLLETVKRLQWNFSSCHTMHLCRVCTSQYSLLPLNYF